MIEEFDYEIRKMQVHVTLCSDKSTGMSQHVVSTTCVPGSEIPKPHQQNQASERRMDLCVIHPFPHEHKRVLWNTYENLESALLDHANFIFQVVSLEFLQYLAQATRLLYFFQCVTPTCSVIQHLSRFSHAPMFSPQ